MIDVLAYLLHRFSGLSGRPIPERVVRDLHAAGFDSGEIETAMEWLHAVASEQSAGRRSITGGFRIFADAEARVLGPSGVQLLRRLEHEGHLDFDAREAVIEWASRFSEVPVSPRRLRVITLALLWRRNIRLDPLLVEELIAEKPLSRH